jgi:hypothetical protein
MRAERLSGIAGLGTALATPESIKWPLKLRRRVRLAGAAALVIGLATASLSASGHGPVFGGATPTLGKGGWSFDQAWMGQVMDGSTRQEQLLRSMISFGITEKVQISGSVPIALGAEGAVPSGRMMAMMSGNRDVEALVGWRFQTRPVGHGARVESTVYVGGLVPLDSRRAGIAASPAGYVAVASGYASRAHYFWAGASHQRHAEESSDRLGTVTSYSLVYGYRPPAWRLEYPRPDLRFFVETVGDLTDRTVHGGVRMPDTGGHIVLVGPTMLLLYKAYAFEGGMLFPVYQRTNGAQPDERFRFALNFTYFFWPGKGKGH